ncbi:MAG: hypothetical protein ACREYF_00925 [Gammaproteobacteria bacterium]
MRSYRKELWFNVPGRFLIEVSFDQIPDEARRERLKRLPTSFQLPAEAVDELRRAAADILEQSLDFKQMLRDQIRAPAVRCRHNRSARADRSTAPLLEKGA